MTLIGDGNRNEDQGSSESEDDKQEETGKLNFIHIDSKEESPDQARVR